MDVLAELQVLVGNHLILVSVLLGTGAILWLGYTPFSKLKNLGIPGPTPWPFVGNLPELIRKKEDFIAHQDFISQYGRVCGYYMGMRPLIIVAEPEMIKQILVKEFSKFVNRPLAGGVTSPPPTDRGLLQLADDDWRRLRTTIAPTFSALKLKQVVPLINEACKTLANKLGEVSKTGKSAEVFSIYGRFTMETIVTTAFGIESKTQTNPNDQFTPNAKKIFQQSLFGGIAILFPFLRPLVVLFTKLGGGKNTEVGKATAFLVDAAREMVKLRRETGSSGRKDFLEIMLSADVKDEQGNRVSKLTDDEIVAQCFTFILAGYETTSNTLAFTSYLLALNPDKQNKVIKEIDEVTSSKEDLDYDTVQGMTYLDMAIQEALRLYPPAFRFGRTCNESCTINGQFFPKGSSIMIPAYSIHRDPEYWPDPLKFEPERFTAEAKQARHPYVHIPFGGGPRVCIGMRFALLEAKMALVHILKEYRLEQCPETEVPLNLHGTITMSPRNGIYLRIAKR